MPSLTGNRSDSNLLLFFISSAVSLNAFALSSLGFNTSPFQSILSKTAIPPFFSKTATNWFNKSDVGDKIKIHQGNAINILESFHVGSFDMLFIDADKINYPEYYRRGTVWSLLEKQHPAGPAPSWKYGFADHR